MLTTLLLVQPLSVLERRVGLGQRTAPPSRSSVLSHQPCAVGRHGGLLEIEPSLINPKMAQKGSKHVHLFVDGDKIDSRSHRDVSSGAAVITHMPATPPLCLPVFESVCTFLPRCEDSTFQPLSRSRPCFSFPFLQQHVLSIL